MATVITQAFEHWNASQVMNGLAARPNKIVFAFIPGLDPSADIDRQAPLPAAEHIVYQAPITQYGLINENAVAYSVVLDTFIGDFDFNYLGLVHEESGTLCMVVHTLTQSKIATAAGQQGNSFTRTFLMEFNGAAESSQITVNAETWQIDYSARLAGIDESVRLSNFDYYGAAAFIGGGFKVIKDADQYRISSGVGYVGGLRVALADDLLIDVGPHGSIWLDVALKGTVTGAHVPDVNIILADDLIDYVDIAGQQHYVAKLAVDDNSVINDVRLLTPHEQITVVLDEHEKSRNHPAATLKDKGLVSLSNSVNSSSQTEAATPKAVKQAYDSAISAGENADNKLSKAENLSDLSNVSEALKNLGLTAIATVAGLANTFPYFTGEKSAKLTPLTDFARNLLSKPDNIDCRTALGLGSAATRTVGTGPNQLPDMSLFGAYLVSSGYQRLPSGLILQWGISPIISSSSVSIVYPIPFPTARLAIIGSPVGSSGGNPGIPVFSAGNTSACSMNTWGSNNYSATWIAIGY